MTLSSALTVAFAVKDGAPSDVREWVSVELAEFLVSGRRGFMVSAEAVTRTAESDELAKHAREIIVEDLRRQYQMPADIAIGRAFAAANQAVFEQTHKGMPLDAGQPIQIGATAVIVDDHVATIGHVPPGQMILIEDGLVYALPDLESWLPRYMVPFTDGPNPEPLGYRQRVSPVIAQTDLRSGDTILLCSTECGQAFAQEMHLAGVVSSSLAFLHGRDPDKILDVFRDLVTDYGIADAAVTVLGFAPTPDGSQIRTVGDVGRRARDSWRRTRVRSRQYLPSPRSAVRKVGSAARSNQRPGGGSAADGSGEAAIRSDGAGTDTQTVSSADMHDMHDAAIIDAQQDEYGARLEELDRPIERRSRWRARTLRVAEHLVPNRRDTWSQPTLTRQFGVPGAHGVRGYKGNASHMGEEGWRNRLPRVPAGRALIWIGLSLILALGVFGVVLAREHVFFAAQDYRVNLSEVDQRILDARKTSDSTLSDASFLTAQQELDGARDAGAPDSEVGPRQQAITEGRDSIHNVLRLKDVTRIGGLPEELQKGTTRVVRTPGGIFLVSGSLYLLQPEEKKIVRVLETGAVLDDSKLGKVTVGNLYGVAYDADGLYATDGSHVFVYSADNVWRVVDLGQINDQGPWPAGSIGAFDSNLYILESEYRNIYRFNTTGDAKTADAIDWVLTGSRPDLNQAVDMVIDGNIYALLGDGRILTFYLGDIVSDISPSALTSSKDDQVRNIVNGSATGYLYVSVVNGTDGRVVAFDRKGEHQYQLELPAGFSIEGIDVMAPFEGLQTITVDEDSGTIYLINGDAIWSARYELPALAQPATATPAVTPQS